ncbi:translation initiation factor eIF-2B epsilon subunit [Nadsonia fulvescens var. elongata DSM 6958]|uniref:Translation initiation factor eIF2B subunit epsilon n=1 Tax=Nadsonia fulvescens var. elongata DSM 6958 TaxID=857566 RepID=A0A1E3PHM6_9ASCO|nr:translation initiation factor eIF-2B epsilon subunit [Nadsonia fulvescens var. elongata DSM 6958]
MPPKKENKKDKKGAAAEFEEETKFQAVVLTDSYQNRFRPMTLDKPRCLLPLVNAPLIEYTLEFLATAGVDEVYIVCCSHGDQIEDYIRESKWSRPWSPFTVQTVLSPESMSVGDAMRDIDTKGLIKSDFLLISGDVVTNIQFDKVLQAHRERKIKDKNSIMTMVLREASSMHRTRSKIDPGVFILDEATDRCIRYEEITVDSTPHIAIDPELLDESNDISVRNDLIDCHIDICSADIPALFQENFDYDNLRKDFVRGILTSDLLGKTIYTHIVNDSYASRVENFQTYDAISRDIISRYTYPICPDSNLLDSQTYSYQSGHIYKENDVVLAQSCMIKSATVIGKDTFVGDGTKVDFSTIGRKCTIGNNVVIEGSYIWDNVTIEDNAIIKNSIVSSNTIIKEGAIVQSGSIVSFGVIVGKGQTIPLDTKLTINEDYVDEQDDDEESSNRLVGSDGKGIIYCESDIESDDYDEDDDSIGGHNRGALNSLVSNFYQLNVSDVSIASLSQPRKKTRRRYSTTSVTTAASDLSDLEDEEEDFMREAQLSLDRAIFENHDLDIAALELNTLRMAMNVSYHEVRLATITTLHNHIFRLVLTDTLDVKSAVNKVHNRWYPLFSRQVFDRDDQEDLLQIVLDDSSRRPAANAAKALMYTVMSFYDNDVVEEEVINKWWNSDAVKASDEKTKELLAKWIDWLQNAESDSSEEESDDE